MTVNCEMCGYIASSEEDLIIQENTGIDFRFVVKFSQTWLKKNFEEVSLSYLVLCLIFLYASGATTANAPASSARGIDSRMEY